MFDEHLLNFIKQSMSGIQNRLVYFTLDEDFEIKDEWR